MAKKDDNKNKIDAKRINELNNTSDEILKKLALNIKLIYRISQLILQI